MKKNTKLALGVLGLGAIAYYLYKKNQKTAKVSYSGEVGNRLGADGLLSRMSKAAQPYLPQMYKPQNATAKRKTFADNGYVVKGNLYNNNMRYGMTGQSTFFTNESEKVNY